MQEERLLVQPETVTVQARSQKMAAALSSYARALTFENRSRRNLYRLAGLAPRTRDRVFSIILMAIIGGTLVLPMAASILYFAFIASPGYASEVRFIVRTSTPYLSRDRYASDTVEPKEKIVQDTAILLNYLDSPAIIQDMQKAVNLGDLYGRSDIDFMSRLRSDATQEDLLKYWKRHFSTSVNAKSGIVELEVTAYSPQEANAMVKLVLHLAEQRVNQLSSGMWDDLRASSQRNVDTATKDVGDLRGQIRDTQNKTGVFDIDLSAQSNSDLLTTVETSIADLRSRRVALSQSVGDKSPQMLDMDRQIAAQEEQAKALRAQSAGGTTTRGGNLADYSTIFDQLKLNLSLAETRLKSAITDLEKVKLVSSLQLVYVDAFIQPTVPDRNKYPNVPLSLFLTLLACLGVCGAACGGVVLLRKKLD
ncbi:MAG: hypothetical protein PW791_14585 [Neorhizobium sp.]|jgi:capsular polysaccharide transport system permease protein|nr:hypothetical protein [Neorhizobium sp.]